MDYKNTPYYRVGRASDLIGKDRTLYRFFEMLPGILSWTTIIGTILLSKYLPFWAAIFIIIFDVYWLLKTAYLSVFLRQNWRRLQRNIKLDWGEMLSRLKYDHVFHMILLPFYNESQEVIEKSIDSLLRPSTT